MPVDPTKLFAQSEVCLFGWLIGRPRPTQEGSKAGQSRDIPPRADPTFPSNFLFQEERHPTRGDQPSGCGPLHKMFSNGAWLASIHAFSCEGRYNQFRTPALFLVTDPGEPVWEDTDPGEPVWEDDAATPSPPGSESQNTRDDKLRHKLRHKLRPERFGLPHLDRNIDFASDLKFWTYDRGAHTVRLDMSAGTVQRLVIDVEAGGAQGRRIDLVGQESTFMGRLAAGN